MNIRYLQNKDKLFGLALSSDSNHKGFVVYLCIYSLFICGNMIIFVAQLIGLS